MGTSIKGWEGTGGAAIGYVVFLTSDSGQPNGGSYGLAMRDVALDAVARSATSFIHVSGVAINNGQISLADCRFNRFFADRYAFYSGTSASLFLRHTIGSAGGRAMTFSLT